MRVSLVVNFEKANAVYIAKNVVKILSGFAEIFADYSTVQQLSATEVTPTDNIFRDCDILITVGGDGTIIHNAKKAAGYGCPVLGINAGRIGYLASLEPSEIDALPKILSGNYSVENRMMLSVIHESETERHEYLAFNDVVFSNGALSRMIDIKLNVDEHALRYRADGLIVATPTGSTAYSLSAGGPVVDPRVDNILITPICSYEYFAKPLVLPSDVKLSIAADNLRELFFTVDGEVAVKIDDGDYLKIECSRQKVKLVKYRSESILDRLERKIQQNQ